MTRHGRTITKPRYLDDYMLLTDQESEILLLTVDGEPQNYLEAEHEREWVEAMVAELESITRNKTWELVDRPTEMKSIWINWIYKTKRKTDGMVNKYKVRLVAKAVYKDNE